MSTTRRLKRENVRVNEKYRRRFDNKRIWKAVKEWVLVNLTFFFIFFLLTLYSVNSHNKIREAVSGNPAVMIGKVVSISGGKGVHAATYEFIIDSKKYSGSTFTSYKGTVGDNLCIEYNLDKPELSVSCDEKEMENWLDDSLIVSLKMAGIMLGFSALFICWKLLRQDKKILAELTSRKGNYR